MSDATLNAAAGGDPSLFRRLLDRRVPHVLGGYVAALAGVVQFVDWLSGRYALSPALTDFALVALLLFVPTVVMLAWRHGQPGRNHWTRIERIGVPANLLLAGGVLFFAFSGTTLGYVTTTVTVEDEEGNAVEREVPKTEFRRHLALFYFDNESGDEALDWLQFGLPRGVWADLRQDFFMDVREGTSISGALREAGRPDGLDLPLALKTQISEEQQVGFFVDGSIEGSEDALSITTRLYEVDGSRLVSERTFSGELYDLIDAISVALREDLGIPDTRLAETVDLPLDELLTDSEEAYRDYVEAFRALANDADYGAASSAIARAVSIDSTFALGHWLRYAIAGVSNQSAAAMEALEAAMEHRYRLPEREQMYVKREYYYTLRRDPERALAMAEMAAEMFPDDLEALSVLALFYQVSNRSDDAMATYERILEVAPTQTAALLNVANLYQATGRYEDAIDVLSRYAELSPEDMRTYPMLAQAHRLAGQLEEAREACERGLLVEPDDIPTQSCVASAAYELGDWERAETLLAEAVDLARAAQSRAAAIQARGNYHVRRGMAEAAIADRQAEIEALQAAGTPPLAVQRRRMETLVRFVRAGRARAALDSAEAIGSGFAAPFDGLRSIGDMDLASALEDTVRLAAAIETAEALIATGGVEAFRPIVQAQRGRLAELRGDCAAAIPLYEQALELSPSSIGWERWRARCLRKEGRLDEAAIVLERALDRGPYAPATLVELARVEIARGNATAAAAHLDRALDVWAAADPGYAPAAEARELRATIEGG